MKNATISRATAAVIGSLCLALFAHAQNTPPSPSIAAPVPVKSTASSTAGSGSFLPDAFDPQDHATTWANPPFSRQVLPDVGPEEVPVGPKIWDGWQIAAVDKFGGKFTVGLVTKKNEFRLIKEGETNDSEGVTLIKVESNGIITDTVVHLSGGGQTGTLTFDKKRLAAGPKNAPKASKAPVSPRAAPRRTPQGQPQPNLTPQQRAAQAQAQAQAKQQMANHLNSAINKQNTGGNTTAQPAPAAAAPAPTQRTRRRSVVLPPSNK